VCSSDLSYGPFGFATLAYRSLRFNHIALASETAQILNAVSLYRLGQRRRQATVSCKIDFAQYL
jgi:hypothetical protein